MAITSQLMAIIYRATCVVNRKSYIGQTIQSLYLRRIGHESSARSGAKTAFASAIRKYGADSFVWEVLEECEAKDLNEREVAAIQLHNTVCPNGYNVTTGGVGLEVHKEHKRKREEDAALPHHIHRFEHQNGAGYRVTLPDGRRKAFMSGHYTSEEKLKMATEWLECVQTNTEYGGRQGHLRKYRQDNDLPAGVTRFSQKTRNNLTYFRITSNRGEEHIIQDFKTKDDALATYEAMQTLIMMSNGASDEAHVAAETLMMLSHST